MLSFVWLVNTIGDNDPVNLCANKKSLLEKSKRLFTFQVVSTGQRSNFFTDLQAIENAEGFIELALERMDIKSLDELDRPVKAKYVAGKSKSRKRLPNT